MSTPTPEPTPVPGILGLPYNDALEIIIIIVIAVTVERFVTRYLSRFSKRAKLKPNTSNNLILTFRILILIGAVAAISRVGGFPSEWLLSVSAIGAAAVGFASQKTIGNFVAGIFLMAARPFKVGNYVRIGTVEGIVSEITINYTKIITSANNIVSVSNLQILDRDITNFLYESLQDKDLYCYTFEIGFDHAVPTDTIVKIFNEVFEKYSKDLPTMPGYTLTRSAAFERVYTIYLYVCHAEDIFVLRPKIAEEVFQRWDEERAKLKK
ncbi:MAG TPA: mechanosensitive ion channel domain-containing protein [Candidatus Deferrimicrobiaceae bacterium]|jgi:small-conductance mechanosensitive channel|nr:mechanosensitive ion channel domain-containing protein [Candidatus Deferrimicrobiaceae bacterium]